MTVCFKHHTFKVSAEIDQTDVSFAATEPTPSEKYTFEWRPQQVSEGLCDKDLSYLWRDGNNDEECAKQGEVQTFSVSSHNNFKRGCTSSMIMK